MADLLGKSTNILRNDELYTEEEKELLKALDLKDVSSITLFIVMFLGKEKDFTITKTEGGNELQSSEIREGIKD